MKRSRLTSKYQATIPKEIRTVLKIKSGDQVVFEVLPDNTVIIRRGTPLDREYLKAVSATLEEWSSPEDEEAYRDL